MGKKPLGHSGFDARSSLFFEEKERPAFQRTFAVLLTGKIIPYGPRAMDLYLYCRIVPLAAGVTLLAGAGFWLFLPESSLRRTLLRACERGFAFCCCAFGAPFWWAATGDVLDGRVALDNKLIGEAIGLFWAGSLAAGWGALWYILLSGTEPLAQRPRLRKVVAVCLILGGAFSLLSVVTVFAWGTLIPTCLGFLLLSARHWSALRRSFKA